MWYRLFMIHTAFQHLLGTRQETTASGVGKGGASGCLPAKLSSQLGSQSSRSFADVPRRAGPLLGVLAPVDLKVYFSFFDIFKAVTDLAKSFKSNKELFWGLFDDKFQYLTPSRVDLGRSYGSSPAAQTPGRPAELLKHGRGARLPLSVSASVFLKAPQVPMAEP